MTPHAPPDRATPVVLDGTCDPVTGDMFHPPRGFSTDGALRALEDVRIDAVGVLVEAVPMGERWFGYVDLDAGPRLLTALGDGPHAPGARYSLFAWARGFERA